MSKIDKLLLFNNELHLKVFSYLKKNIILIIILLFVALATYGFELFNLNLTIDEEIYSTYDSAPLTQMQKGRWGMYYLYDLLFPFTIIPFVPLFVALLFQIIAVLLLLGSLNIEDKLEQLIFCVIGISYPGLLFIYSFSTVNYGIGIGFFFVALSLNIYVKNKGIKKYWAIIPAVLALSIYQPFIPVLVSVYLLFFIYAWVMEIGNIKKIFLEVLAIFLSSVVFYYLIHKLLIVLYGLTPSSYIDNFFNLEFFLANPFLVLKNLFSLIFRVLIGSESVFGIKMYSSAILIVFSVFGLLLNIYRMKRKLLPKVFLLILCGIFLLVPFLSGILYKGSLPLRNLIGLPFVLSGFVFLGFLNQSNIYKSSAALITVLCFFQFITSSNHLSASSYLSLEADRLLGYQVISRIEEAKGKSTSSEFSYLEIVGYYKRPESLLIPKIETIGASFFEWDRGNPVRIVAFLHTLGYSQLQALPLDQRYRVVSFSNHMPNWPSPGSVDVIDDVVVVKFGAYSSAQTSIICQSLENRTQLQSIKFCP